MRRGPAELAGIAAHGRVRCAGRTLQSDLIWLLKVSGVVGSCPGAPARVWGPQDGSSFPRFFLTKPSRHRLHRRPQFRRLATCRS